MPVIELPEIPSRGLAPGLAVLHIHAVMCFPNDARRRRAFITLGYGRKLAAIRKVRDHPQLSGRWKEFWAEVYGWHLPDGSWDDLLRDFTEAIEVAAEGGTPNVADRLESFIVKGGLVAANVLLSVLYYAEHDRRRASINHALDALGKAIKAHDGQHSSLPTDRGSLRGPWSAFRPAAHLWAAQLLVGIEYARDGRSETTLGRFLAMAEDLRARGELHVSPHARPADTLLKSNETWRVPENLRLPPVDVSIPPPKSAPAHNGPPSAATTRRGRSGMKTRRWK